LGNAGVSELFGFLATLLLFTFVVCCVVSAALQIIAWSRHAREGAPVSLRALWKPEGHFDEVGLRQIQLARRLLLVGGIAYLSFGALNVAVSVLG
jgi:hypothetical protein